MSFKGPLDYVDVATRIVEFRTKYPDGSLQPADLSAPFTITEVDGKQAFIVVAAAYRSPEDTRPGIGMAYEPVPGSTSFTRGSELQNAETAAWGRAIVAALAADTKKGIASSEEVRNRQAEAPPARPWSPQQAQESIKFAGRAQDPKQALRKAWQEASDAGSPKDVLDLIRAAATEAPPIEGVVQ